MVALLEKAGSVSVRPEIIDGEDLSKPYGFDGGIYRLSPAQVGAILELRLHRLTGLEQDLSYTRNILKFWVKLLNSLPF